MASSRSWILAVALGAASCGTVGYRAAPGLPAPESVAAGRQDPEVRRGDRTRTDRDDDAPQETRTRRPPRRGSRPGVHPRSTGEVSLALGEFTHHSHASAPDRGNFDDDARALTLRLRFEGVRSDIGGGMQLELTGIDDKIHDTVYARDVDAEGYDLFGHLTLRPTFGDFVRMPIRIGPYIQGHSFDAGRDEMHYRHIGGRVQVEPEFDLFQNERAAASLYLSTHVGGGWGNIQVETRDDLNDFDTSTLSWGVELGMRARFTKGHLAAGFVVRRTRYDESDEATFFTPTTTPVSYTTTGTDRGHIAETDLEFEGIFIGGGWRW